jgi:pullulanase
MMRKGCRKTLYSILTILCLLVILISGFEEVHAENAVDIRIHYLPAPGDQRDWDLWVWTNEADGEAYSFNKEDDYGKLAQFQLPPGTKSLQYLVRLPDWSERDCSVNRTLQISNEKAEVWLKGGTCEVSLTDPLQADTLELGKHPQILPDAGLGGISMERTMVPLGVLLVMLIAIIIFRKRKAIFKNNDLQN